MLKRTSLFAAHQKLGGKLIEFGGWEMAGQYTLMTNERGGVVDDLYAYRLSDEVFLLIINASRIGPDVAWMQAQAAKFSRQSGLQLTDASHNYAAVAVQGPRVKEFIDAC